MSNQVKKAPAAETSRALKRILQISQSAQPGKKAIAVDLIEAVAKKAIAGASHE